MKKYKVKISVGGRDFTDDEVKWVTAEELETIKADMIDIELHGFFARCEVLEEAEIQGEAQ